MKKKVAIILMMLTAMLLIACEKHNKPPYSMKLGAYGFENAVITNILTNEVTEKSYESIMNNNTEHLLWGWMLGFSVDIKQDTEYIFKSDNRYFVLNEGLAFELIYDGTLKLHFPRWQGYYNEFYDIVIVLEWQKSYG